MARNFGDKDEEMNRNSPLAPMARGNNGPPRGTMREREREQGEHGRSFFLRYYYCADSFGGNAT